MEARAGTAPKAVGPRRATVGTYRVSPETITNPAKEEIRARGGRVETRWVNRRSRTTDAREISNALKIPSDELVVYLSSPGERGAPRARRRRTDGGGGGGWWVPPGAPASTASSREPSARVPTRTDSEWYKRDDRFDPERGSYGNAAGAQTKWWADADVGGLHFPGFGPGADGEYGVFGVTRRRGNTISRPGARAHSQATRDDFESMEEYVWRRAWADERGVGGGGG